MSLDVELYCFADTGSSKPNRFRVYDANYTHNCSPMAQEAGIYDHVWRPDEIEVKAASDLIEPLAKGIALMESEPARFRALNPANGWGDYESFLQWLKSYLAACIEHPKALVSVSR